MTKKELEELLEKRKDEIRALKESVKIMCENHKKETDALIEKFQDDSYTMWKHNNAEFLDRWLREWMVKNISIETRHNYDDSHEIVLNMSGDYLTSDYL